MSLVNSFVSRTTRVALYFGAHCSFHPAKSVPTSYSALRVTTPTIFCGNTKGHTVVYCRLGLRLACWYNGKVFACIMEIDGIYGLPVIASRYIMYFVRRPLVESRVHELDRGLQYTGRNGEHTRSKGTSYLCGWSHPNQFSK